MAAIETHGLVHQYKTHFWQRPSEALTGLDLVVEEGEIFGYLGANGAGKTTTIKILVGLQRQTRGSASLFGIPVEQVSSRAPVGFQPENPYFYEYLSARESMHFYAGLCDVPKKERAKRSDELLEFVGLREASDVRVGEFSKGMRQRLGIAQALVNNPKLVILDEPMSGLDPVGRLQVRTAILSLKEKGMTVFFSSHVLADMEMICDRVGVLQGGKLTACGPIHELLHAEDIEVEVGAESIPSGLRKSLTEKARSSLRQGKETIFSFPSWKEADIAVKELTKAGSRLTLLRPVRESLEDYFMRTTGENRVKVGAWKGGGDA